jgi:hypothetical protein
LGEEKASGPVSPFGFQFVWMLFKRFRKEKTSNFPIFFSSLLNRRLGKEKSSDFWFFFELEKLNGKRLERFLKLFQREDFGLEILKGRF